MKNIIIIIFQIVFAYLIYQNGLLSIFLWICSINDDHAVLLSLNCLYRRSGRFYFLFSLFDRYRLLCVRLLVGILGRFGSNSGIIIRLLGLLCLGFGWICLLLLRIASKAGLIFNYSTIHKSIKLQRY
jgi:hypothetical protein